MKAYGDKQTIQRKKKIADHCKAFARGSAVQSWCNTYNWPKERNWAFSKYSQDACVKLAAEFCRRSNHYYSIWWRGEALLHHYTDADVVDENLEFLDFVAEYDTDDPVFEAYQSMKELMPNLTKPATS